MGFIHPMPFQVSSIILVDDWAMFNSNVGFSEGNWWLLGVISSWDNIYIHTYIHTYIHSHNPQMIDSWDGSWLNLHEKIAHDFTWCTTCGIHVSVKPQQRIHDDWMYFFQLEKWTDCYINWIYIVYTYIYIHGCCWWYIHMILMVY